MIMLRRCLSCGYSPIDWDINQRGWYCPNCGALNEKEQYDPKYWDDLAKRIDGDDTIVEANQKGRV